MVDWDELSKFITEKYIVETDYAWKLVNEMKNDYDKSNREKTGPRNFIIGMLSMKYRDKFINFTALLHCTEASAKLIYDVYVSSVEVAGRIMRLENF